VLVDRGPDDDHDVLASADDTVIGRGGEALVVEDVAQHLLRPVLPEGQFPAQNGRHGLLVDVVDADLEPARGERDGQREADVASPADNYDVEY